MPLFMFYVWEQDDFGTTHLPSATTNYSCAFVYPREKKYLPAKREEQLFAINCESIECDQILIYIKKCKNSLIFINF